MRIALLVLSIGNFGNKGFYNLQEVGLAKELSKLFDEVLVYRLVGRNEKGTTEQICHNTTMYLLPSKQVGSNGIPDLNKIDKSVDAVICFSDTQLFFNQVEKWCRHNHIKVIPYIGVSKSHSNNLLKQKLIDVFFNRNLTIYRQLGCIVKTPAVAEELSQKGVKYIQIAPVGLDVDLLNHNYNSVSLESLKRKYGFNDKDRIILFIGRMTKEKRPIKMIDIFKRVYKSNMSYRLLMIGSGELDKEVAQAVSESGIEKGIKRIEKIPNNKIWEVYRMAECLVNLNQQEIYGMALLEAMYYECKVIAWAAPGPDYILRDGETGWIVHNDEEVISRILNGKIDTKKGHDEIIGSFTWRKTADIILQQVNQK